MLSVFFGHPGNAWYISSTDKRESKAFAIIEMRIEEGSMSRMAVTVVCVSLILAETAVAGIFSSGPRLLEARCAVCHPSSKVKVLKRTRPQWDAIVTSMTKKGAKLSAGERKTLVDYLAKTYKP